MAAFIGIRYFKLDRDTSFLIGAGSSICGAAAILATEPILKASNERVTVAVSTIVIFGTVAIFLYPVMYSYAMLSYAEYITPGKFGIYIGSTVHEVAQVVATANAIGDDVTNTAVIAKMVRVMMLAPFLIALSAYVSIFATSGNSESQSLESKGKAFIKFFPVFAVFFLIAIGINSTGVISPTIQNALVTFDNFILALAMGALGLTTHLSAIAKAGIKPLQLAAILFIWLLVGGGLINTLG